MKAIARSPYYVREHVRLKTTAFVPDISGYDREFFFRHFRIENKFSERIISPDLPEYRIAEKF